MAPAGSVVLPSANGCRGSPGRAPPRGRAAPAAPTTPPPARIGLSRAVCSPRSAAEITPRLQQKSQSDNKRLSDFGWHFVNQ